MSQGPINSIEKANAPQESIDTDDEERLDTMPSDEGDPSFAQMAAEREIKELYRATQYVNSSEDTEPELSYGQRKFKEYKQRRRSDEEAFSFRNTNAGSKKSLHSSGHAQRIKWSLY